MSTSTELGLAALKERVDEQDLKIRARDRALIGFAVALLVALGLIATLFIQRGASRTYYNDQLRNLACLAVKRAPSSVSQTVRDLRDQYHCPAYQPSASSSSSAPPQGDKQPVAPRTRPAGTDVRPAPRATPPATSSFATTRRRGVPTVTATATKTTTTTARTPPPAPSPTQALLPSPICTLPVVRGVPIIC